MLFFYLMIFINSSNYLMISPVCFPFLTFFFVSCVQVEGWCADSFRDMAQHLGDYDSEEDFQLSTEHQKALQSFLLGSLFNPFLAALDRDTARVEARKEKAQQVSSFKDFTRNEGLRDLGRWLDDNREFDPDDFVDVQNPTIPIKYGQWVDLARHANSDENGDYEGFLLHDLTKAVTALLGYTNKMHWKLDYLLRNSKHTPASGPPAFAQLATKHPSCWNVMTTSPRSPTFVPCSWPGPHR